MGYKTVVIIGLGGFLGAASRYYLSGLVRYDNFPYGTLLVNFVGCLGPRIVDILKYIPVLFF